MKILINAIDTLFFRDAKPFSKGDDTWANGIFPPYPSTIYGALRTAALSTINGDLSLVDSEKDPGKNLKINNISYRVDYNEYFPVPADLVAIKSKKHNSKEKLRTFPKQVKEQSIITAKNSLKFYPYETEVQGIEKGIIEKASLEMYLSGGVDNLGNGIIFKLISNYLVGEPKIGISLKNDIGATNEGDLYRVGMLRPKGIKLLVDFDGLELPENGFLKLGGEGKVISYTKFELSKIAGITEKVTNNKLRLYLSTPAFFKFGWLPDFLNKDNLIGDYNGLKLKLISAFTGKPLLIGGFDMKIKKPKKMCKAVPAGSVYYFEILGDYDLEKINAMQGASISGFNTAKEGYGISYWGIVND